MVWFLGPDYPGELAADRLYDDHLYRGASVYPGGCDGGGADRRSFRYSAAVPRDDPDDDAVDYDLYVPVHHKRIQAL